MLDTSVRSKHTYSCRKLPRKSSLTTQAVQQIDLKHGQAHGDQDALRLKTQKSMSHVEPARQEEQVNTWGVVASLNDAGPNISDYGR